MPRSGPVSDPAALRHAIAANRGAGRLGALIERCAGQVRHGRAARTAAGTAARSPRAEALAAAHPPPPVRLGGELPILAAWWRSSGYHKRMAARALLHLRANRQAARARGWNWRRADAVLLARAALCRRRAMAADRPASSRTRTSAPPLPVRGNLR